MKIGMTLLLCETSTSLVEANVLSHFNQGVDYIVCSVDRPSLELEISLQNLRVNFHNRFFYRNYYEGLFLKESSVFQSYIVNNMVEELISKGCDWVINCDDDELYVGETKSVATYIEMVDKKSDIDCIYTHGYCYYQTSLDDVDCDIEQMRMVYRDNKNDYEYKKPIFRSNKFVATTAGNHFVALRDRSNTLFLKNILIHHYTNRCKKDRVIKSVDVNGITEKGLLLDTTIKTYLDPLIYNYRRAFKCVRR